MGDDIKEPSPKVEIITDTGNPFRVWLKAMGLYMLDDRIETNQVFKTKALIIKEKPMPKKPPGVNRILQNISVKTFIDDYVYRIDLDADYQREKIWTTKQ